MTMLAIRRILSSSAFSSETTINRAVWRHRNRRRIPMPSESRKTVVAVRMPLQKPGTASEWVSV